MRRLESLDRRTTAARAAFELRDAIADDLGGRDRLTAMEQVIVDNVATLGAALEDMATAYLSGEDTDLALYATLANAQRRLLADLGLERRADLVPDLKQYLSTHSQKAKEAA